MPKAKKLPSGQWRCQALSDGERRSFTRYTKKEAELAALEWQTGKKDISQKGLTAGDAAIRYLDARSAVLSPKSIKENKGMLRRWPYQIESMPLSDIDMETVQIWVNEMALKLAPKTVKNYYGFFASIVHCFAPSVKLSIKLPQMIRQDIYIPTHDEVSHLLAILSKSDNDLFTSTLMASNMGLRRGEICALENNRVNFKKRKIDIHQAFVDDENNKIVLKTTKTYDSNRVLTAPGYIAEHLLDCPKKWEYIVTSLPHNITQRFETVVKKEFDNPFTFHDLRHYYASVLIAEGVPERYAMHLLGHSTPNMLRKVYGHIMSDKEDEISKNINAYFSKKYAHENAHEA